MDSYLFMIKMVLYRTLYGTSYSRDIGLNSDHLLVSELDVVEMSATNYPVN